VAVFSPIHPSLIVVQFDSIDIELTYLLHGAESFLRSSFAASQEIRRILWNPKIHYRTHKRPPTLPILGEPNPVHIPSFQLLEIHHNIIHSSTPRSPQQSLCLRFPHQDPIRPLYSPYAPNAQPIIDIELVI